MSERIRRFDDEQAAAEYALLWRDMEQTLRRNAFIAGIIDADSIGEPDNDGDSTCAFVSFILQSEPVETVRQYPDTFTDLYLHPGSPRKHAVQLWAGPADSALIGNMTLIYSNAETGEDEFVFDLYPGQVVYHDEQENIFVTDARSIGELRGRFHELRWDAAASAVAAQAITESSRSMPYES
jgi:hypothetical protein